MTYKPFPILHQNASKNVILMYRSNAEALQHQTSQIYWQIMTIYIYFLGIYLGRADGRSFIASSHQSKPQ